MKVTATIVSLMAAIVSFSAFAAFDNPVIIYGGVGNLGRSAQPCLAALYESNNQDFRTYTKTINDRIRDTLSKTVFLPASARAIVGSDQLYDAIKDGGIEFTDRPTHPQVKEFLENNEDNLLTLAVVGTVETYIQNLKTTSKGSIFEEHFIVGVTAVLVQTSGDNPGQIVLTGSALTEVINESTDGFSTEADTLCKTINDMPKPALEKLVVAYADAAERAIANMAKSRRAADGDNDSVLVTGVSISSTSVQDLFNVDRAIAGEQNNICNQRIPCVEGDRACQTLVSLVAFGVTEAFSSKGYLAIPPLNWRSWGKTAEYQAAKNVKLTGGHRDIAPFVTINVGPNSADRKLLPVITKFAEVVRPMKGANLRRRIYMGWMNVNWEITEGDQCESAAEKGVIQPKKKSYGPIWQTLVTGKYLNNEPPVNVRRFHYVGALMRTMGGLGKSIDEPK